MNKFLFLSLLLCGFTPITDNHDTKDKIDQEFKEIEATVQPKLWRVFSGTPTLQDLGDKEVVIVSSNGWSTIMWRDNVEVYKVTGSCVTVLR